MDGMVRCLPTAFAVRPRCAVRPGRPEQGSHLPSPESGNKLGQPVVSTAVDQAAGVDQFPGEAKRPGEVQMFLTALVISTLAASDPLLSVDDTLARGATAVYTITICEGIDYWVLLGSASAQSNFDVVVASRDMDFDQFMSLPYYEDYQYARGFAIAEGAEPAGESFTVTAPYTGPAYIVIHDTGSSGGEYELKVY